MVGVLCSPGNEEKFARVLHRQLGPRLCRRPVPILVFSMPNVDLTEKTVYGSLISAEGAAPLQTGLPPVIFNYSIQHRLEDIRKLRGLREEPGVKIINPVNRFDQFSLLQAFSLSPEAAPCLLPCRKISLKNNSEELGASSQFLLKPLCGANLSSAYIGSRSGSGCELLSLRGGLQIRIDNLSADVSPVLQKKKCVLLELPEAPADGQPAVTRTFFLKGCDGSWSVLRHRCLSGGEPESGRFGKWLEPVLLMIVQTISGSNPDLGLCFVDLLHLQGASPYFIGFGGWRESLMSEKQDQKIRRQLSENIYAHAEQLMAEQGL